MSTSFTFTQEIPASTWTIEHNLNCAPIVDVLITLDGILQKVIPLAVEHVTVDTMVVTFSSAQSGEARLIGLFVRPSITGAGSIDPGSP